MPLISPSFIDDLKDRMDIVDVVGKEVKLTKRGAGFVGLSPFTGEKTPSFTVNPAKQMYYCFSSDQGGDAINFLMRLGRTYPQAIEEIADLYNLPVRYDDSKESKAALEKRQAADELAPLMVWAAEKYHRAFLELPEDHPAKVEARRRGYDADTIEAWQIGYASGEKVIYASAVERGMKEPATRVGLISESNDKYRDRLIFPIRNHAGTVVGIAGRTLSTSKKTAKWINPKESELYEKSTVLFGFHAAKAAIAKSRTVRLVEGYADVIAAHMYGATNVVGLCGVAISDRQISALRKIADRVVLCLDADDAGRRATAKLVPALMDADLRVMVIPDWGGEKDIDDFCEHWKESVNHYGLEKMLSEEGVARDGFGWLMEQLLEGTDALDSSAHIRDLCGIVARMKDEVLAEVYIMWLSKRTNFTKAKISRWVKDAAPEEEEQEAQAPKHTGRARMAESMYRMPEGVDVTLDEVLPTIEKYRMFQTKDRIWMLVDSDDWPYYFREVSNFSVHIVQHMNDEKYPTKLIRVKNVHGEERIFDVPSSEINTPQSFDKVMTDQGNFFWKGNRGELMRLREYLYDEMGVGRKIDVMGRQPEGFWAWVNHVRLDDGSMVEVDENGVVRVNDVSYYIPAANKLYANNPFRFSAQKKVVVVKSPVSFSEYASQMRVVHRDHAITALLFTIASMFQDIAVEEAGGGFPLYFLYGPASSGKDQLAYCCQSFFGVPQEAINLEGGVSTIKAQVREFAQFANMISQLSEYHSGDTQLDGVLKGLWDRRGYKRGTIESHVSTESIPILSSVLMTGNDYPQPEALVTRLIAEEMTQNQFGAEAVKEFEKLEDMTKAGISSLGDDLLKYRGLVAEQFQKKFRAFKQGITDKIPGAHSRMLTNLAQLGAFYSILKDEITFPFTHLEMTDHMAKITRAQMAKIAGSSMVTRWWHAFLAAMSGRRDDRLMVGRDFEIKNGYLYFNMTHAYNNIQLQWFPRHREIAPKQSRMFDELKKDASFYDFKRSERIGDRNTSCMVIDLKHVPIAQELQNAADWQANERTLLDQDQIEATNDEYKDSELPF